MGRLKKIKGKYYDTGTSNKSFLLVAKDLKSLGIKNFYFMLELNDPSLIGVDPFDPNLTRDQVSRVMTECTRNMWYYLREVCRIPDAGGAPVPYKANRGNIAQAWCLLHGIDSWLSLPRQQGKTVSLLSEFGWGYSFGTNDSTFIFVNKDSANAKENLQRLKDQIDALPEYLRFEQILEEDDSSGKVKIVKATKNATTMKHPITHNKIIIKPKASSYEAALSLARGMTSPLIHFDEPEFTNHIKTIIENSVSTFDTAARNAKKNHALYGRCFTCTPGDLDTAMGLEAQEILSHTTKWTEKMYDMHYDPDDDSKNEVLQYVKSNGDNSIVYIEYSYKQLGLSEEWLRDIYNKISNPLTFKREILLQRLRGSSDSPFDRDDLDYIISCQQDPIDELYILEYFRFDIYKKLERRVPYIISVDCSTGTNGDNNAITIIDPRGLVPIPVAEFKCPYIGETMYENLIKELITMHLPRGVVVIERNSVGDGIIDHLLNSHIRQNLYFDKNRDLVDTNMKNNETIVSMLKKQGEIKTYYGVWTGTQSRDDMMAILFRHVAEYKENFVTKNITEDLSRLVRTRSGRVESAAGFHDDSVMSYLIGLYIYYHGNNLQAFGIIKGQDVDLHEEKRSYTVDDIAIKDVLPESDLQILKMQEETRKKNDYEELMKKALIEAQRDTYRLHEKGLIHTSTISNTPDDMLSDTYDDAEIDMSLFDSLNGY